MLVKTPLHPPLAEAVANHVANVALTAPCVRHAVVVVFTGQVNTTVGGAGTVKVLVHDCCCPHASVPFQVTSIKPPQIDGGVGFSGFLVTTTGAVPPEKLNVANQALKAALRAEFERHAAVVVVGGQLNTIGAIAGCVIVCEVEVTQPSADSTVTV